MPKAFRRDSIKKGASEFFFKLIDLLCNMLLLWKFFSLSGPDDLCCCLSGYEPITPFCLVTTYGFGLTEWCLRTLHIVNTLDFQWGSVFPPWKQTSFCMQRGFFFLQRFPMWESLNIILKLCVASHYCMKGHELTIASARCFILLASCR